jgi:hypothetical protein
LFRLSKVQVTFGAGVVLVVSGVFSSFEETAEATPVFT